MAALVFKEEVVYQAQQRENGEQQKRDVSTSKTDASIAAMFFEHRLCAGGTCAAPILFVSRWRGNDYGRNVLYLIVYCTSPRSAMSLEKTRLPVLSGAGVSLRTILTVSDIVVPLSDRNSRALR